MTDPIVIAGASVAGVRTARALRSEGHAGPIVLIGAEAELPYDKPPLSKQFLAGEWDAARVRLLDADAAAQAGIELRLGSAATGVDLARRTVALADGSELAYDRLVIATGADARPSPWAAASGVHLLRTLADSRALHAALTERSGPVVVVGAGFIGAEVAATAHALGRPVTLVDPLPVPAERVAGAEIGALLAGVHARHGVTARLGTGVKAITGSEGALTVSLADGTRLDADTVVVGIGVTPATGWLEGSGLAIDDGVVCGADCATVDDPRVFAVGDVARWHHAGHEETVRVEHWTNAGEQARCVAHNLAHPDDGREHRPTEYVWSDQYSWKIQIAGRPGRGELGELIGDPDTPAPRFVALYRDAAGRIGGAVAVGWARALVTARRQISEGATFEDARDAIGALAAPASR